MRRIGFIRAKKERNDEKHHLPRRSLSSEDKRSMLAFVRSLLRSDYSKEIWDRSGKKAEETVLLDGDVYRFITLSVAFWVGGTLRGCIVVHQQPLKEALEQATFRAMRDSRFKPVGEEEVEGARIEITVLTPWRKISVYRLREQKELDPTKAYRIFHKNRQGWLLPEVFNCLRFHGTDDFLRTLIVEKAGLHTERRCLEQTEIEIFEADDFIESEGKNRQLSLTGPLVRDNRRYNSFDEQFAEDLERMSHQAASQLIRIQEEDGNIPSVIDPLSGKIRQVDWVRLALTAVALESFGKVSTTEEYRIAARKAGEYIWKYGYGHPYLDTYTKTLCRVYYAEYLWCAGRTDEAKSIAWELSSQMHLIRFEPIFFLKSASLFLLFKEREFLRIAEKIFESIWNDFEKNRNNKKGIELARFPELIVVAETLFAITQEHQYQEKGAQVAEWLILQQHIQGSFPSVAGSGFAYTRGTGKIFEALAFRSYEHQESLLRAFEWLQNMQYSRENVFFVKPEHHRKILGGFRHDAFNQEVWIDASSHVLLGSARILRDMKTIKKQ
ncbi:MAG: AMMECR1 domain-containing protein [Candidatus Moranbacteria bacterium]|nr:AMMECR1 domain-containing protein [Candidatus Moranbacteria bacterium]